MFVKAKDQVVVLTGKDKGKQGQVTSVAPKAGKLTVEGVAMVTKHQKARAQGQQGGIVHKEAYIDAAPDAGKIDRIIQHIYREEYPQAISQLARLRQEHPDYCPQAFAELSAALTTPNRLKLLLLCTRLPLGVIQETHIMK